MELSQLAGCRLCFTDLASALARWPRGRMRRGPVNRTCLSGRIARSRRFGVLHATCVSPPCPGPSARALAGSLHTSALHAKHSTGSTEALEAVGRGIQGLRCAIGLVRGIRLRGRRWHGFGGCGGLHVGNVHNWAWGSAGLYDRHRHSLGCSGCGVVASAIYFIFGLRTGIRECDTNKGTAGTRAHCIRPVVCSRGIHLLQHPFARIFPYARPPQVSPLNFCVMKVLAPSARCQGRLCSPKASSSTGLLLLPSSSLSRRHHCCCSPSPMVSQPTVGRQHLCTSDRKIDHNSSKQLRLLLAVGRGRVPERRPLSPSTFG